MKKLKFKKSSDQNKFYLEVKAEVNKCLGTSEKKIGPNLTFWAKALFWFILCWGSYYLALISNAKEGLALLYLLVFVLSGLIFGFSIGHDASHRVLSKRISINEFLHFISFVTIGIEPTLWGLRHIRSHHIYPNVEGSDIDIDKNPFLRLSPSHPWKAKHKYQHLYAPFVYALAFTHSVFWGDFVYLFSEDYKWMREGVRPLALYLKFFLFKSVHFLFLVVLPYYFLNFSLLSVFILYIILQAVSSLVFIVMLVGTHFFLEASFPEPNNKGEIENSWAIHNLLTSCDWNPDSTLSRFLSGGANCHAAHHLFPNICHIHYGKINPIIKDISDKHHVVYYRKTLYDMMASHFKHLKRMGREFC